MPPDPLNLRLLSAKYKFKQFFLQGVQLTYFENTPAIQNSTPPSKNSGHGPVKTMTLKPGTSSTSVPSGSSFIVFFDNRNIGLVKKSSL